MRKKFDAFMASLYDKYPHNFKRILNKLFRFIFLDIRLESMKLRLSSPGSGLVEVLYGDEWGYVCVSNSNNWRLSEANVVCRELGYSGK